MPERLDLRPCDLEGCVDVDFVRRDWLRLGRTSWQRRVNIEVSASLQTGAFAAGGIYNQRERGPQAQATGCY